MPSFRALTNAVLAVAVISLVAGSSAAASGKHARRAQAATFETGIVSGSDVANEPRYLKGLDARVVRVEFGIGRPASALRPTIAAFAANGSRVLLQAGFARRLPTAAEARNLRNWAREFGPGG